jgi:hypothetical protein
MRFFTVVAGSSPTMAEGMASEGPTAAMKIARESSFFPWG